MAGINALIRDAQRGVLAFLFLMIIALASTTTAHAATSCAECAGKTNQHTAHYLESIADQNDRQDYLIQVNPGAAAPDLGTVTTKRTIPARRITTVHASATAIRALLRNHAVERIELDAPIATLGDTVPWGVNATLAPTVWNITNGTGVKVAILDTGIAPHPDLVIAGGTSIVSDNYTDTNGHGTAVAGVVAAIADGQGIVGVAPSASLYAVKVLNGSTGSTSDAIAGVQWAIDNNMSILVMSFGTTTESEIFKSVLQDAYNHGILLIAASGNDGGVVEYPAAYESVIAVGAIDENNASPPFSSRGYDLELVAPGVSVTSTSLDGNYSSGTGTSFAAPHVAGIAALLKAWNQSLTNIQLRGKLRNDAYDLWITGRDDNYGYGIARVNLTSNNYTLSNDSYDYQIFNITDYGSPNQTAVFWINGTGSIDDMSLDPGYYRVTTSNYFERVLNVSENGTISLLATMLIVDNYSTSDPSEAYDGVVWNVSSSIQMATSTTAQGGECWDYNYSGTFNQSECYFVNGTASDDCFPHVCPNGVFCSVIYPRVGQNRTILNGTSPIKKGTVAFRTYAYSLSCDVIATVSANYAVVNEKRFNCTAGGNYTFQGHYGTNSTSWTNIGTTIACSGANSSCDPNAFQFTSNDSTASGFPSICRISDGGACSQDVDCFKGHYCASHVCQATPPVCTAANGTVFVSTEDTNGNPVPQLSVYLNGAYNTSTDAIGLATIHMPTVTCSAAQNITVKCSDNVTLCDAKYPTLSVDGANASVNLDCHICTTFDLSITPQDVLINRTTGDIIVQVHATQRNATNVNVSVFLQDQGILIANASKLINVTGGSAANVTFTTATLTTGEYLNVYVDKNGTFNETKLNNYVLKPVVDPVTAVIKVHVDSTVPGLNQTIYDYIASYVTPIDDPTVADFIIDVGPTNNGTFDDFANQPTVVGSCTLPYCGVVRLQYDPGIFVHRHLYVSGNGLDGDLAAVKRLINARSIFLFKPSNDPFESLLRVNITSYITDYDSLGISVADHLHNAAAQSTTYQNSTTFLETVKNILYDNNYEINYMTVKTLNTTSYNQSTVLRIKHVSTDFSPDYQSVVNPNATTPLVFSGGIFSSITTWEDASLLPFVGTQQGLARTLANNGYDVWELEISGGPNTDCLTAAVDTCPNYTYSDQVDHYWPVSIAGILKYTGKSKVDYVGHSNGGRVALSALNKYSLPGKNATGYYFDYNSGQYATVDLPARPVRKFVGVAIPSTLNDKSELTLLARGLPSNGAPGTVGDYAMNKIYAQHLAHVSMFDYLWPMETVGNRTWTTDLAIVSAAFGTPTISTSLMQYYNDMALNQTTTLNLSGVSVDSISLVNTAPEDVIVPYADQAIILNGTSLVAGANKTSFTLVEPIGINASFNPVIVNEFNHGALVQQNDVLNTIKGWLR